MSQRLILTNFWSKLWRSPNFHLWDLNSHSPSKIFFLWFVLFVPSFCFRALALLVLVCQSEGRGKWGGGLCTSSFSLSASPPPGQKLIWVSDNDRPSSQTVGQVLSLARTSIWLPVQTFVDNYLIIYMDEHVWMQIEYVSWSMQWDWKQNFSVKMLGNLCGGEKDQRWKSANL